MLYLILINTTVVDADYYCTLYIVVQLEGFASNQCRRNSSRQDLLSRERVYLRILKLTSTSKLTSGYKINQNKTFDARATRVVEIAWAWALMDRQWTIDYM